MGKTNRSATKTIESHNTQGNKLTYLSLALAMLALLVSLPSGINQLNQYLRERDQHSKTEVLHYSPTPSAFKGVEEGAKCWGSVVSDRTDAYRCRSGNLIHDPCFTEPSSQLILYCPESWISNDRDTRLLVKNENIVRPDFNKVADNKEDQKGLPWLIVLEDKTECRLHSGSVDVAYGSKGNIYACSDDKYSSVTTGDIDRGSYYFDCKLWDASIFKKCYALKVVY